MTKADLTPNRLLVLLITLCCFGIAAGMWLMGYSAKQQLAFAGLIRVGVFMGAVWLALPTATRSAAWKGLSPWVIACMAVAVFLIPRLKFSVPIVIGMLVLGAFIKPRNKPARQKRKRTIDVSPSGSSEEGDS